MVTWLLDMITWLRDWFPALAVVVMLFFCWLTGSLAARKGYDFGRWSMAAPPFGLIVLAFLPFVNPGDVPPDSIEQKRERGNRIADYLMYLMWAYMIYFAWSISRWVSSGR